MSYAVADHGNPADGKGNHRTQDTGAFLQGNKYALPVAKLDMAQ